jgi:hypothetical protein
MVGVDINTVDIRTVYGVTSQPSVFSAALRLNAGYGLLIHEVCR